MYMSLLLKALATVALEEGTPSYQNENRLNGTVTGIFTQVNRLLSGFTPPPPSPTRDCPPVGGASSVPTLVFRDPPPFNESDTDIDLRFITALWEIPNLVKYLPIYFDLRNFNKAPFFSPLANGPAPQQCKKHELIIARAAGELGDFGFIVGDPLLERVQRALPDTHGYAVQYPATVEDNPWKIGVKDVIHRLNTHSQKCPDTKFALVGYSQGAYIIRKAAVSNETNPVVLTNKVVGAALFGDPWLGRNNELRNINSNWTDVPALPKVLEAKVINSCSVNWNKTDPFCYQGRQLGYGGPTSNPSNVSVWWDSIDPIAHVTYNNPGNKYIEDSAAYLVKLFKEHQG